MARLLLVLLLVVVPVSAQFNLALVASFTDPLFAGNGTIGVCLDSFTGDIWVVDFSNAVNLYRFDFLGNLTGSFPTNVCTPPMSSPNGLTQNRQTGELWLVDNSSPATVLSMDLQGQCNGGWTFAAPSSNPVSISHNVNTNTLFIGSTGQISEWSLAGGTLPNGFVPGTLSGSIISGLAFVPTTGNYICSVSGGNLIYEFTPQGTQVSTFDVSVFGIGNIQGLDYDPFTGKVLVADNNTATIYVCQDTLVGSGYQIQIDQPWGPGSLQVTNLGLTPGNEVYNVFSLEPCLGGVGNGPWLGLCTSNPQTLIDQLLFPAGTFPFHYFATGPTYTTGPFGAAIFGVTIEAVSFELLPGGIGGNVSPVFQLVIP